MYDTNPAQRSAWPFHPLLAATFPVLSLYTNNMGQVGARQIMRPLGLSLLGTLLVWIVVGLMARSVLKGAVAASTAVLVFFSYGHMLNLVPPALAAGVGIACCAVMAAVVIGIWRSRSTLRATTAVLNMASVVLVLPSCAILVPSLTARPDAAKAATYAARHRVIPPPASPDLPDVYYVILDAYLRSDRLAQFYGYDNTAFIRSLEKRGFYVAPSSLSNYDQTNLSLASSLNLTYLGSLAQRLGPDSEDVEAARRMLDDNAVAAYLRALGYHYVFVWTGAGQTRNDTADLKLYEGSTISSFETNLLGLSALQSDRRVGVNEYDGHRRSVRTAFESLCAAPRLPYPKFVFAHIAAPHPPFVFGANGEARNPVPLQVGEDGSWLLKHFTPQQYRDGYVSQVQYINGRVLQTVDAILKGSSRPPIIILQGDHGSRLHLDWESLAKTDLREPFSILNAYHVPASVRPYLYPRITPVNTFRVLLTHRFGAKYPLLPDRSYYSTAAQPYNFVDVTRAIPDAAGGHTPLGGPQRLHDLSHERLGITE